MSPTFSPGSNIAIKVPTHEYDATVAFYGQVLGLKPVTDIDPSDSSRAFAFGDKTLWVDAVAGLSQAEIWLEIITDDLSAAQAHFTQHGCSRRDDIEPLPDGLKAFWISGPGNIIHLIAHPDST